MSVTATATLARVNIPRRRAVIAVAGLVAWPVIVIALHLVQLDNYHPSRQAVSELSRGRGGALMAVAFSALGVGTIAFAMALRVVSSARVAPVLFIVSGICDFVSAIFRADVGDTHTTTGHIHDLTGMVTFALIIAGMFATTRPLRKLANGRKPARVTAIWAIVAVVAFFLFPLLGDSGFGIAQRTFITSWLSWLIAGAIAMQRVS